MIMDLVTVKGLLFGPSFRAGCILDIRAVIDDAQLVIT
jgi:hypothetical protein